jgi:hypothetical protein
MKYSEHINVFDADYTINKNQYVFSNEILALPIGIQLNEDRSGEGIESFNLSLELPSPQPIISADIVFPSSVTVVIIDDDCT